jgi:uncharacterized RDD family membrane protein YckC
MNSPTPSNSATAPGGWQPPGSEPPGQFQGHPLAGWGPRAGAALIDALGLFYGPMILGMLIAAVAGGIEQTPTGSEPTDTGALFIGVMATIAIALGIYNVCVRQGRTGQTFGKQLLGIRLVRMSDGQPVGVGLSLGRYLLHWADMLPLYVGWLWPLWDARRQTFADKIARTVVLASPR